MKEKQAHREITVRILAILRVPTGISLSIILEIPMRALPVMYPRTPTITHPNPSPKLPQQTIWTTLPLSVPAWMSLPRFPRLWVAQSLTHFQC